jgi:threonine dehydrogenase-like Zn-dependent dehydrogenase
MRATVIHAPRDIRIEQLPSPRILQPTDAILRVAATSVCGTDLWDYRGINPVAAPHPIGHEYVGVVEEVGTEVELIRPGQFVVGSFFASDNTCPICHAGYHTSCPHREFVNACQAEYVRVPLADGTLVATPDHPDEALVPHLLALSDVMGTGWYAAAAAQVQPGMTVVVVGDGAVGLSAVLSARELGAGRIIAMSRREHRQRLARAFGATDIVTERGEPGVQRIRELTGGIGADAVLECVGTRESMVQSLHSTRPGGAIGFVGVPHDVEIPAAELFYSHVGLRGGPAPVRAFLPDLIEWVWEGRIEPGRVFDLELPLDEAARAYRAMDERSAVKVLLRP